MKKATCTYAPPPTVKTYMKNSDLKFELQLTKIDKGEEGEIAVEE